LLSGRAKSRKTKIEIRKSAGKQQPKPKNESARGGRKTKIEIRKWKIAGAKNGETRIRLRRTKFETRWNKEQRKSRLEN